MSNWCFDYAQSRYDNMEPDDDALICIIENELYLDSENMKLTDGDGDRWDITIDDYEEHPDMFDLFDEDIKQDILENLYENGVYVQ